MKQLSLAIGSAARIRAPETKMKLKNLFLCLMVVLCCVRGLPAQQPQAPREPEQQPVEAIDEDDVVRVTTNLVQFDAVVTDKQGRIVRGLTPNDFELRVNGRKQQITNFSFNEVSATPAAAETPAVEKGERKAVPATGNPGLGPRQVGNTFVLVLDDYCISFESFNVGREQLRKFVAEKLGPNDTAAVLSTRLGTGRLQQFTRDRRLLNAVIDNLHWKTCGKTEEPFLDTGLQHEKTGEESIQARNSERESDAYEGKRYGITAIGALDHIADGLRDLPGRKAIILFSDGLPLQSTKNFEVNSDVLPRLREVIEKANRASAVVYPIHLRGIDPLLFTAQDRGSTNISAAYDPQHGPLAFRRREFNLGLDGLHFVADNTGGFVTQKTNDFSGGVAKAIDDQRSYYLIGYRPEDGASKASFNDIKLTLKHPDYRVRTRSGFSSAPVSETPRKIADRLLGALRSPVNVEGVRLRLTSFLVNQPGTGFAIRSLLHLNAGDLSFAWQKGNGQSAGVELMAVTLRASGLVVDEAKRVQTIHLQEESQQQMLREGLVYVLNVPVKHAGAYDVRLVVRDLYSNRIGSAHQFVEVPKLDTPFIASLVVKGTSPSVDSAGNGTASLPGASFDYELASLAGPAVRQFQRDMTVEYGFQVFAKSFNGQHGLASHIRVLRDGREAFVGQPKTLTPASTDGPILGSGSFSLAQSLTAGWYTLEVNLIDISSKKTISTQWVDFEIVE